MKTKGKFNSSYRNIITVILITVAAIAITVVVIAFKQKIIRMIHNEQKGIKRDENNEALYGTRNSK